MAFDAKTIALALRVETAQFTAGLGMAGARVKAFAGDVQGAAGKSTKAFQDTAKASESGLSKVGTAGLLAGGAIVAGFGLAVHAAMGFDRQMSEVGAVAGATGDQLGQLRTAAIDAGQATVFSASEAAKAEAELAKAGVSVQDILSGGLTGALNLASAGSLELASAAELAANAMTTFGLSGSEVPHIADVMAAAANKSATDVGEMGMALKQGGLVAAQFGVGLEQTSGTLALFAQSGLKGSDAGTSFKTMLQRLVPQSAEAQNTMDALGLSFFGAGGKFVGLADVAEQLRTKLGGLSDAQRAQALTTLFGSDAIRGAAILMENGAAGVNSWTDAVDESGYAAELARQKTDNLAGDLEQLKGSIETALIDTGSKGTGVLRAFTQGATDFVNGISAAPPAISNTAVVLAGLAGTTALAVGAVAAWLPKWEAFTTQLGKIGPAGDLAAAGIGKAAGALALAAPGLTAGITLWGNIEQAASEAIDTFTKSWEVPQSYAQHAQQLNSLIAEYDRLQTVAGKRGSTDVFTELWQNANPFIENTMANAQAATHKYADLINQMEAENDNWAAANIELQHSLGMTQDEVDQLASKAGIDLRGKVEETVPAVKAFATTLAAGTPAAQDLGASLDGVTDKTKSAEEKFKDLSDAIKGFISIAFGEEDAADALERKLLDLQEAAANGQLAFEGNSGAALDFREKMRGLVDGAGELITEWARTGVQGEDLRVRVFLLSQDLINQATAMGIPKEAAQQYFNKLNELPENVYVNIHTTALDNAIAQAGTLAGLYERLNRAMPSYLNPNASAYGKGLGVLSANGNLFTSVGSTGIRAMAFAGGGMYSENHVAQIAPAGAWRMWAEPETGGEAYIPLAASKRDRALPIYHQVGRILGEPGSGPSVLVQTTVDARGSSDPRAVRAAVDRAIGESIPKIKRALDKSDRRL